MEYLLSAVLHCVHVTQCKDLLAPCLLCSHGLSSSTTADPDCWADQRWEELELQQLLNTFWPFYIKTPCIYTIYIYIKSSDAVVVCQWCWVRWSRPSRCQITSLGWRRLGRAPATTWARCCSWFCPLPLRSNRRCSKPTGSTTKEKVRRRLAATCRQALIRSA